MSFFSHTEVHIVLKFVKIQYTLKHIFFTSLYKAKGKQESRISEQTAHLEMAFHPDSFAETLDGL